MWHTEKDEEDGWRSIAGESDGLKRNVYLWTTSAKWNQQMIHTHRIATESREGEEKLK